MSTFEQPSLASCWAEQGYIIRAVLKEVSELRSRFSEVDTQLLQMLVEATEQNTGNSPEGSSTVPSVE